jgi:hypothetical protein
MEYKFKTKWDEDTDISCWKKSRIDLNKIIDDYNNWQIEQDFSVEESRKLLAKIEYGKQTIGSQDGGSGYWDELDEMEQFVKSVIGFD